jgi:hypothetical protein
LERGIKRQTVEFIHLESAAAGSPPPAGRQEQPTVAQRVSVVSLASFCLHHSPRLELAVERRLTANAASDIAATARATDTCSTASARTALTTGARSARSA